MIIGGTGDNAVLKHFLTTDIGKIRIFSRDEKNSVLKKLFKGKEEN